MKRSSDKIYLISLAVILTIPLAFLPPTTSAIEYTFTPIDVPGAYHGKYGTSAYGINDSNNIVGYYYDATGSHGFLYVGGGFTPIDVPGAYETWAKGSMTPARSSGLTMMPRGARLLICRRGFTPMDVRRLPGHRPWD